MAERPLTAAARERVIAAIRSGATIEAIRLYRQDTLASLADARRAVESMAAPQGELRGTPNPATDDAVVAALYAGRKIEAIKQYRLSHRVDLRGAKEAVEAIEADLRVRTPERFATPATTGGRGPRVLLVLILLAAAAGIAWHFIR